MRLGNIFKSELHREQSALCMLGNETGYGSSTTWMFPFVVQKPLEKGRILHLEFSFIVRE